MSLLPVGISGEEAGYQIERSLRFNSADSAYLNRTPGSAGNRKTFTLSAWVKRGALSAQQVIFGINSASTDIFTIAWLSGDTLRVFGRNAGSDILNLTTTAVYRDPSAWYHIVIAIDTTQATASNRARMYVNGVEVTAFGTATYPAQNTDLAWNSNSYAHDIGRESTGNYFNGYLTEINFIDGSALDPTSFGEFNTDTGVWQPKKYTGSYGTNGFYLNFSDNSGVTSTTLGADSSGNGNNWTPNNFSVTAGAGNDSLVDTPTNYGTDTGVGGEVRGNYCTLNPLNSAGATLTNGNLDCVTAVSGGDGGRGTIAVTSGKWYWEFTPTNNGNQSFSGIALTTTASGSYYVAYYAATGNKFVIGSGSSAYGATYTNNDVIGVALDLDSGTKTVTFYKNNVSQGAITITPTQPVLPIVDDGSGSAATTFNCNFGQRPFAYTAPSGFKALCTQNLPEPTIVDGGEYFNTVLYTGNGSTQSITGVGFQPDFTWIKSRSNTPFHNLYDAVRGATKVLFSNATNAEVTNRTDNLTSFDSDGFSLGADTDVNASAYTYVGWNWKANGAGVSNTAGTITSTVSANTDSGFSIVTYTGNGSAGATWGHGLGVAPAFIIVKGRTNVDNWMTKHQSYPSNLNFIELNTTNALGSATDVWNNTAPTSTVVTVGTGATVNSSGVNYVAYCFAAIPGYSAFGSYTGNGSADGPFVYTGFRPAFVMVKVTNTTNGWMIMDDARAPYNPNDLRLQPSSSAAEGGANSAFHCDLLSNGFKWRTVDTQFNGSGDSYIFAAFCENPFKYALAR